MPLNIPTAKDIKEVSIANFETKLGQSAPIQDKAFLRVQSGVNALTISPLYKYGAERAKQNLILTATGEDLELLGAQYGVDKIPATPAILTVELPAINGTIINPTRTFVSELTGLRYTMTAQSVAAGGVATFDLTSTENGDTGNLDIGNTLVIDSPVPNAESIATVTAVVQIGTEEEIDDVYRTKVLDAARSTGGGGNASDYRSWSQEVAGVQRAYPYSGKPVALQAQSSPPDRTVYIEATSTVDPEGIAPPALLDAVRDSITTDPVTGLARQPLGLTDETLYIESISRTGFYVTINGLLVSQVQEAQLKQNIEDSLDLFFSTVKSFVPGLDPLFERNDLVTDLVLSDVIQDVLKASGASANSVGFGLFASVFLSSYRLKPGELAKLVQVDYVQ